MSEQPSADMDHLATGSIFRRVTRGRHAHTAQVIEVRSDLMGIPHVRFWLHHEQTQAADELRTLALAAFHEQFPERAAH